MESNIDIKTVITLAGVLFTVSNGIFLFIWNNLKADNKALKEDIQLMLDKLDTKADKSELDQRRNDIKDLYRLINTVENSTKDAMHGAVMSVTNQISELKGMINANPTTRRR